MNACTVAQVVTPMPLMASKHVIERAGLARVHDEGLFQQLGAEASVADQVRDDASPVGDRHGPGSQVGLTDQAHGQCVQAIGNGSALAVTGVVVVERATVIDEPQLAARVSDHLDPEVDERAAAVDVGRPLTER